ncbi:hypothetical protein HanIR_Chr06g0271981 [Helianthus annuus]|nr:hypothetical protein HanIR_Chr06g0271981 [Helianthus annuus]
MLPPLDTSFTSPSLNLIREGVLSDLERSGILISQSCSCARPARAASLIAAVARTCSWNRICTTIRSGSRSFCAACMDACADNFFTSINSQTFFFSTLVNAGCSFK